MGGLLMEEIKKQLEVIKRGCVDLVSEEELIGKLKKGKPLRVKCGFDPTLSDLHLGHTVVMQKMRQFQDLGHHVIFLIGDYTAQIGDPSGRSDTRKQISRREVMEYAKTYVAQAHKLLDRKKTEIRYNSEWLEKMSAVQMAELASKYTVARMLERDDYKKRFEAGNPLGIHEFMYPLWQGYDSVALKADVELGGTDQIFNLLVGRDLQRAYSQEPQVVLTMPLLIGTDGQLKMSKTYDNYIGVTESPREMFGKLMSISDDLMWDYYKLLSARSLEEIRHLKKSHPKSAKIELAKEIVERFHGGRAAIEAAREFDEIFAKKKLPTEMEKVQVKVEVDGISAVELLVRIGMAGSKTEARRLIQQGGVSIDEGRISDINHMVKTRGMHIVRVGRRRFKQVLFK